MIEFRRFPRHVPEPAEPLVGYEFANRTLDFDAEGPPVKLALARDQL
jgi:hypothetical protein